MADEVSAVSYGSLYSWGEDSYSTMAAVSSTLPQRVEKLSRLNIVSMGCSWWHSVAVSSDGRCFVWGENKDGELGLGEEYRNFSQPQLVPFEVGIKIKKVSCGSDVLGAFTMFLSTEGQLYSCGRGLAGQLGHGKTENLSAPTAISGFGKEKVIEISCGGTFAAAVTEGGAVYSWGKGSNHRLGVGDEMGRSSPTKLEGLKRMIGVSCGDRHGLSVGVDGMVYAWGCNKAGQCGVGRLENKEVPRPRLIETLKHRKVHTVAAGNNHSAALDTTGGMYTWGGVGQSSLGHGNLSLYGMDSWQFPRKVLLLEDERIVSIAAGEAHTLAVSKSGLLYSWGRGALGHGSPGEQHNLPRMVSALQTENVSFVSSGSWHSMAVTGSNRVADDMGRLFDFEHYVDMHIQVDDQMIPAHKCVLCARSEMCKSMLMDTDVIELNEVKPEIVRHLVRFIYTDAIDEENITAEDLELILQLGEDLQVHSIRSIVELGGKVNNKDSLPATLDTVIGDEDSYPDVKFVVEGEEIWAHRPILAARSQYFDTLFSDSTNDDEYEEVDINNLGVKEFKEMLHYLYSGRASIENETNAWNLLRAADRFNLQLLKDVCENVLMEFVSPKSVDHMLVESDAYHCGQLKEACMDVILNNVDIAKRVAPKIGKHLVEEIVQRIQMRNLEKSKSDQANRNRAEMLGGEPQEEEKVLTQKEQFIKLVWDAAPMAFIFLVVYLMIVYGRQYNVNVPLVNGVLFSGFIMWSLYKLGSP